MITLITSKFLAMRNNTLYSVYGINNHIMHIIEPSSEGGPEGLKPSAPPLKYLSATLPPSDLKT